MAEATPKKKNDSTITNNNRLFMAISILGYKSTLGLQSILCNKYIENIQTLSEYSMFFAFNNQIDTKMKRIATLTYVE